MLEEVYFVGSYFDAFHENLYYTWLNCINSTAVVKFDEKKTLLRFKDKKNLFLRIFYTNPKY